MNTYEGSGKLFRPLIYEYASPIDFMKDLLRFYKSTGPFSLRQRAVKTGACSQALVSQILLGKRQLNRENLSAVAKVFKLTQKEYEFIDGILEARALRLIDHTVDKKIRKTRQAKNHLLSDWLSPYVKDLIHLKGFSSEPSILFSMLGGLFPNQRVKKTVDFLLREGFWRIDAKGKVVPEDSLVVTTNEIPNDKIKNFHKKALQIAMHGISTLPVTQRKASTVLLSVDRDKIDELRGLIDSFHHQLLDFVEKNPQGKDALIQVAIHLTPVGRSYEKNI